MLSCEKRVTTKVREIFEKREVCLFFCAQFECALRLIKNLCNANRIPMICQFYSRTGVTTSVKKVFSSRRMLVKESNCHQSGAKECVSLCVLNHHHPAIISHPTGNHLCVHRQRHASTHTHTHTHARTHAHAQDQSDPVKTRIEPPISVVLQCAVARSSQALLEDPRLFSAKRYCATLIRVVAVLFTKKTKKVHVDLSRPRNLAPVARTWAEVLEKRNQPGYKKLRPCCHAHPYIGCIDTAISDCVCAKDAHCCSKSWDIKCTETVEALSALPDPVQGPVLVQCGRCPREPARIIKDRLISRKEL